MRVFRFNPKAVEFKSDAPLPASFPTAEEEAGRNLTTPLRRPETTVSRKPMRLGVRGQWVALEDKYGLPVIFTYEEVMDHFTCTSYEDDTPRNLPGHVNPLFRERLTKFIEPRWTNGLSHNLAVVFWRLLTCLRIVEYAGDYRPFFVEYFEGVPRAEERKAIQDCLAGRVSCLVCGEAFCRGGKAERCSQLVSMEARSRDDSTHAEYRRARSYLFGMVFGDAFRAAEMAKLKGK